MNGGRWPFVRHVDRELLPDPSRVVATSFVPGQELLTSGTSRASAVLDRVARLDDDEVDAVLADTLAGFSSRHRDLTRILLDRFAPIEQHLGHAPELSLARRLLVGACFTQEYGIETAALFNPSIVAHPDQSGIAPTAVRFVMSLRGVGEGHISSIEFRTGVVDEDGSLTLGDTSGVAVLPVLLPTLHDKAMLSEQISELTDDPGVAEWLLAGLPEAFGPHELQAAIRRLDDGSVARGSEVVLRESIEWMVASSYSIRFPSESSIDERVIMPTGPAESHGLEDVRLVRFEAADGSIDYRGTYTAFDGARVAPQAIRTRDFVSFDVSPLAGPAAKDKGLAFFPRMIDGRYFALSRWDRETSSLAVSDDMRHWEVLSTLHVPTEPWEVIKVGNCGSPLETEAGWLVLTHGVGPMREYCMGAMLLDLDDPRIVLGRLREPLLRPRSERRSGYVPNVVYSCGGMLLGSTLVLPYGCNDSTVRMALVDVPALVSELLRT